LKRFKCLLFCFKAGEGIFTLAASLKRNTGHFTAFERVFREIIDLNLVKFHQVLFLWLPQVLLFLLATVLFCVSLAIAF
jgi:hypothetical protein